MTTSIDAELLRNIYPLNKLGASELAELQPGLRRTALRQGRGLYSIGDAPAEYFYVLDGSMQLVNAEESEFTTVAPASGGESIPLPFVIPALERAFALSDCELLAVDRERLNALMQRGHGTPPRAPAHHGSSRRPHDERSRAAPQRPVSRPGAEPPPDLGFAINNWQQAFLATPGYGRLPAGVLQAVFARMSPRRVSAGDILVEQGEPAEDFLVIAEGEAEVVKLDTRHGRWVRVNAYGIGGAVGEDALISNLPRNATVRMLSDGLVMALDGDDFRTLIKPELARPLGLKAALNKVAINGQWLDVRMPNEFPARQLRDAVRIPHPVIRAKLLRFDEPERPIVVVCATRHDSPVIAALLRKQGLDAYYLKGGIESLPQEVLAS